MNRRQFLQVSAVAGVHATLPVGRLGAAVDVSAGSRWHDASVSDLLAAMEKRQVTAAALTEQFLRRIEQIDRAGPALRSVIETNPDAAATARSLDDEREAKGARGPLH